MSLPICPDTKVGALLDAYPALEATLISIAPAFENLRNPMLRRTVAKVATLTQAARVGGVPVNELVRCLREAAGLGAPAQETAMAGRENDGSAPVWVSRGRVILEFDGDRMLEQREHPIGKVRNAAATLGAGDLIRLTTSFRPDPLIEVMRGAGLSVYSAEAEPGRHVTWLGAAIAPAASF